MRYGMLLYNLYSIIDAGLIIPCDPIVSKTTSEGDLLPKGMKRL